MTTEQAPKPQARIVVPFRVSPSGKAAYIKAAERAGYANYTAWIRDVLAAEAVHPKHNPKPKE